MSLFKSLVLGATLCAVALLSCCKQPVEPGLPRDEPDTVRSSVRAIVNAPSMTNQLWSVNTPDTVYARGSIIAKTNVFAQQDIANNSINFEITSISNLRVTGTVLPPGEVRPPDTLHAWNSETLGILFKVPRTIITPWTLDTLNNFEWQQYVFQEGYTQGSSRAGEPPAWTFSATSYLTAFVRYSFLGGYAGIPNASVERVQITIDSYSREKRRISGRFSFRVIGANGEVIDIREGNFQNVQLLAR